VPNYRRSKNPGSTYFFTVNALNRSANGPLVENIELLRSSIRGVISEHPVVIDAIVVLPDHMHCIWTMPEGDSDYPKRWALIKSGFSRALPGPAEAVSNSRAMLGERGIWQRRYWEHMIRDERDFRTHTDYIHFNPVQHGYVCKVREWPYSSFHKYVKQGVYSIDWGDEPDVQGSMGER